MHSIDMQVHARAKPEIDVSAFTTDDPLNQRLSNPFICDELTNSFTHEFTLELTTGNWYCVRRTHSRTHSLMKSLKNS